MRNVLLPGEPVVPHILPSGAKLTDSATAHSTAFPKLQDSHWNCRNQRRRTWIPANTGINIWHSSLRVAPPPQTAGNSQSTRESLTLWRLVPLQAPSSTHRRPSHGFASSRLPQNHPSNPRNPRILCLIILAWQILDHVHRQRDPAETIPGL